MICNSSSLFVEIKLAVHRDLTLNLQFDGELRDSADLDHSTTAVTSMIYILCRFATYK